LKPADFELAASKNIVIELLTTNYIEDRRLSAIVTNGDGSKVLGDDGTYKTLPTKISQLENDSEYALSSEILNETQIQALIDASLGVIENGTY
jgi:hypothetical protein